MKRIWFIVFYMFSFCYGMNETKQELKECVNNIWSGIYSNQINFQALTEAKKTSNELKSAQKNSLHRQGYDTYKTATKKLTPISKAARATKKMFNGFRPHSHFRSFLFLMKLKDTKNYAKNYLIGYATKLNSKKASYLKEKAKEIYNQEYHNEKTLEKVEKEILPFWDNWKFYKHTARKDADIYKRKYDPNNLVDFFVWAKQNQETLLIAKKCFDTYFKDDKDQSSIRYKTGLLLGKIMDNHELELEKPTEQVFSYAHSLFTELDKYCIG